MKAADQNPSFPMPGYEEEVIDDVFFGATCIESFGF
jgi:hypothetical protein